MQDTNKIKGKDGFADLDKMSKLLNQKEFTMLCNQRGLVPDTISPDDLMYIFKSSANDE
jgi:hypothetical protein